MSTPSATNAFVGPTGALRLEGNGTDRLLHCRVLQSPLAGVSDGIFRGLVRRWAPDALLFTEMVNATALEMGHGGAKMEALDEDPRPSGCSCSTTGPTPWPRRRAGRRPPGPG